LYWVFKWPRELARFVNNRLEVPLMKPDRTGLAVFIAFVVFLVLDRGLGMICSSGRHRICRVAFALRWRAAGSARGGTAFFVNIALRRVNAKRDTLDLIICLIASCAPSGEPPSATNAWPSLFSSVVTCHTDVRCIVTTLLKVDRQAVCAT